MAALVHCPYLDMPSTSTCEGHLWPWDLVQPFRELVLIHTPRELGGLLLVAPPQLAVVFLSKSGVPAIPRTATARALPGALL
jgi:hypothetical protein